MPTDSIFSTEVAHVSSFDDVDGFGIQRRFGALTNFAEEFDTGFFSHEVAAVEGEASTVCLVRQAVDEMGVIAAHPLQMDGNRF